VQLVVDSIPMTVLVLNKNRQIVLSNRAVLNLTGLANIDTVLGLRPGELLKCIHSKESESVCGTTEFCQVCGAANAIVSSQNGIPDVKECRISTSDGGAIDIRVWTTPFHINQDRFTIFSVSDTTDEKRRRALERIFFHDIMNSLSAIRAMSEILKDSPPEDISEVSDIIYQASERVINEINSQKELAAAESGDLNPKPTKLNSNDVLNEIAALYRKNELAKDKNLILSPQSEGVYFVSDEVLVFRVIGNMVKNALEASDAGDVITLKSERVEDKVRFSVHNPGCIPQEVQLQIFQRSFSTKGRDRGLGTYSIRLLCERYLKGTASFSSSEKDGTTFSAVYPINWDTVSQ
jgi:signal transduction histidine kinase